MFKSSVQPIRMDMDSAGAMQFVQVVGGGLPDFTIATYDSSFAAPAEQSSFAFTLPEAGSQANGEREQ